MKLLKEFGQLDFDSKVAVVLICLILSSGICEIVKIVTNGIVNGTYR